jgi:hypothetical protein
LTLKNLQKAAYDTINLLQDAAHNNLADFLLNARRSEHCMENLTNVKGENCERSVPVRIFMKKLHSTEAFKAYSLNIVKADIKVLGKPSGYIQSR